MLDATRLRVLVAVARYGSVTAAAQALNYAQPSISHHMARLEAETGAKLMERSGRGVRLTEAGRLLAERAEEILGRLDAAEAELAAHVGLRKDRVRLAAFGAALATLAATAAATLGTEHAATDVQLTQAEPALALHMLRAGEADVAVVYRQLADDEAPGAEADADQQASDDLRFRDLLDDPFFLITPGDRPGLGETVRLADCAARRWILGPALDREALTALCRPAGFAPDIAAWRGDYVAVQALVAAGLGVSVLTGLELRACRHPGIAVSEIAGATQRVSAVTYGDPPDPPASTQLVEALRRAAEAVRQDRPAAPAPAGPGTQANPAAPARSP